MCLSDAKIRSINPIDKPFKLTNSHGMYLLVNPSGLHPGLSDIASNEKNPVLR